MRGGLACVVEVGRCADWESCKTVRKRGVGSEAAICKGNIQSSQKCSKAQIFIWYHS